MSEQPIITCKSRPGSVNFSRFDLTRERRGSVVVSTSVWHAAGRGSITWPGMLLGVKTWLSRVSTLEMVSLS